MSNVTLLHPEETIIHGTALNLRKHRIAFIMDRHMVNEKKNQQKNVTRFKKPHCPSISFLIWLFPKKKNRFICRKI